MLKKREYYYQNKQWRGLTSSHTERIFKIVFTFFFGFTSIDRKTVTDSIARLWTKQTFKLQGFIVEKIVIYRRKQSIIKSRTGARG